VNDESGTPAGTFALEYQGAKRDLLDLGLLFVEPLYF